MILVYNYINMVYVVYVEEASNAAANVIRGFDLNEAVDVEEDNEGGGGFDLNMPAVVDDHGVPDDNVDGGDAGGAAEA